MRGWLIAAAMAGASLGHADVISAQGQGIEIDKTLIRIYGTAIRSADVREARLLKLVPEAGAGDDAVQKALENRLLILREMMRSEGGDPGKDLVAERRRQWTASWPAGTDLPGLMAKCGTTEQALDAWFRGEVQIQAFVTQKFGTGPDRDAKYNEWIAELRRRANLR